MITKSVHFSAIFSIPITLIEIIANILKLIIEREIQDF